MALGEGLDKQRTRACIDGPGGVEFASRDGEDVA
jgi:hypothetical protein